MRILTERVPLLVLYKHDGRLHVEIDKDEALTFEIYGFLSIYLEGLHNSLTMSMEMEGD